MASTLCSASLRNRFIPFLESEPSRHQNSAHCPYRNDSSKCRRVHNRIDGCVFGTIENVGCRHTHFEHAVFPEGKDLRHCHVEHYFTRTFDAVTSGVAVLSGWWNDECTNIEPFGNAGIRHGDWLSSQVRAQRPIDTAIYVAKGAKYAGSKWESRRNRPISAPLPIS